MNQFTSLLNQPDTKVSINIISKPYSDFWVIPERHQMDGNFSPFTVKGNFNVTLGFRGDYETLYDQAGMMVYFSDTHWLKAGIELIDKIPHISAVTTKTYSDWSVIPLNTTVPEFHRTTTFLQLSRRGHELMVSYQLDNLNKDWIMFRNVHGFFVNDTSQLGPMLASPQSSTGFQVEFNHFEIAQ